MSRSFTVYGNPKGKGRPRASSRGKFIRMYTPKKTKDYEDQVKEAYLQQYADQEPYTGYISAFILCYYPIPKSVSKKVRGQMLSNELLPDKTPDLDNVAKLILDGLNGIAFGDDKQIVNFIAEKFYSETPRVQVTLSIIQCTDSLIMKMIKSDTSL